MSILHIDSSARLIGSNTRIIGQYHMLKLKKCYRALVSRSAQV